MNRFGLVLGAGGTLGLVYHLGVLEGLRQSGLLDPALAGRIVGTSAGALVAASLVDGVSPQEFLAAMAATAPDGLINELRSARASASRTADSSAADATPVVAHSVGSHRSQAARFAGRVPGLLPTNALARMPVAVSERWDERLWITAIRVRDGATVVFGRDLLGVSPAAAIAASCAVPFLFDAQRIGDERYLDGALASATHADLLADDGHELVVVSAPMARAGGGRKRMRARGSLRRELECLKRSQCRVLVLTPNSEVVREARGYPMRRREARWAIVDAAARQTVEAVRRTGVA